MENKLVFGATTLTQYNWNKYELLADYTYYWKLHTAIAEYLYTYYWSKNEVVNNGYAWHRYNLHDAPITDYCYGVYKRITENNLLQTGNFPSNFESKRIGYSVPDVMEKNNISYFTVRDYYNLFGEYPVDYYVPDGAAIECYPVVVAIDYERYIQRWHEKELPDNSVKAMSISVAAHMPWVRLLVSKSVYDYILSCYLTSGPDGNGYTYNDKIKIGSWGDGYSYRKGSKTLKVRVYPFLLSDRSRPVYIRNNSFVEAENGAYVLETDIGESYYKYVGYGEGHYVPVYRDDGNVSGRTLVRYDESLHGDYDYVVATKPRYKYVGEGNGTHNLTSIEDSTDIEFYYNDESIEYDYDYFDLRIHSFNSEYFADEFIWKPIKSGNYLTGYEYRYFPPTKYVFNTSYTPTKTFYSSVPDYFNYYKYWREGAEIGKPTLRYTGNKPKFNYSNGLMLWDDSRFWEVNNGYMNNNQFYPTCKYMDENGDYNDDYIFSIHEGINYENESQFDIYVAILQPSGNSTVIGLTKFQVYDEVISNFSTTYIKEGIDGNYYYEFYGAITTTFAYDYYNANRDRHITSYIGENDTKLINDGYVFQSKTETDNPGLQQIDTVNSHNYNDYPQRGMKNGYYYILINTTEQITGYHKGAALGQTVNSGVYETYPKEGYADGYWYSYDKYTVVYRKGNFIDTVSSYIESAYPQDNYILNRYWYVSIASTQVEVPELEINNTLLMGGVNYQQEINPSEDLMIGAGGAAQVDFIIFAPDVSAVTQYLGKDFTYYVKMTSDSDWRQMGIFTLTTAELPDKQTAKIEGFDYIYKFDVVIDEWLDSLTFPMTLGNLFNSLCQYVGCEAYSTEFNNSNFIVNDNFEAVQITGRTILQYITEVSGGFCVAEPDGRIHIKQYSIPPTGTINLGNDSYVKYTHEIYNVPVITSVVVRKDDEDEGVESNV